MANEGVERAEGSEEGGLSVYQKWFEGLCFLSLCNSIESFHTKGQYGVGNPWPMRTEERRRVRAYGLKSESGGGDDDERR